MNDQKYNQVLLIREIGEIVEQQVTWIPKEKAIVGKIIDLGKKEDFSRGWKVAEVFSISQSHDQILEMVDRHKKQREASDL